MKIGIIGTSAVGCACALAAAIRGSAREIVLVNRTRKTAEAVAADIRYGTPLGPKVEIADGDYDSLHGAALVMITAGINEKIGGATNRDDPQAARRSSRSFQRTDRTSSPPKRFGLVCFGSRISQIRFAVALNRSANQCRRRFLEKLCVSFETDTHGLYYSEVAQLRAPLGRELDTLMEICVDGGILPQG
jgi:lactate/malate dehydrogenase, NAD binding domain